MLARGLGQASMIVAFAAQTRWGESAVPYLLAFGLILRDFLVLILVMLFWMHGSFMIRSRGGLLGGLRSLLGFLVGLCHVITPI